MESTTSEALIDSGPDPGSRKRGLPSADSTNIAPWIQGLCKELGTPVQPLCRGMWDGAAGNLGTVTKLGSISYSGHQDATRRDTIARHEQAIWPLLELVHYT